MRRNPLEELRGSEDARGLDLRHVVVDHEEMQVLREEALDKSALRRDVHDANHDATLGPRANLCGTELLIIRVAMGMFRKLNRRQTQS